ncbi:unnamed protein product, partial [Rotaria sp. Silwood2]
MDSSGSQQNSSGNTSGNVITLNNNDLMQQRTTLGNGQQIILKTSGSPTSTALPQGQILQTADGQLIILQSAEQSQSQQPQYVQVGGQ